MKIDRFLLADHGSPRRLANAITDQLPKQTIPVPIEEIAGELDITEIRFMETEGFEGGLIAFDDKSEGIILLNPKSSKQRQRFTIGHELGHFLIPTHTTDGNRNFSCTKEDLQASSSDKNASRREIEANLFSAELLMPEQYFKTDIRQFGEPDIEHIRSLAKRYNMSTESTARRYVELNDYTCAIVFSHQNNVRYSVKNESFPWLEPGKNDPLPKDSLSVSSRKQEGETSQWEEVKSNIWISDEKRRLPENILEQTLQQQGDHGITLLFLEQTETDEDDEETEWPEPTFGR